MPTDKQQINKYYNELNKINNDIKLNTKNLIYLLNKCNIEYINLLEYHYTFKELINKRNYIEKIIFDLNY